MDLTTGQWYFLTLTGLITLFIFYARRKHSYWERQGVKGPKPLFLAGNTFSNFGRPVFKVSWDMHKQFGKIVGFYDGLQPHITIGDPELLRHICIKDFHIFPQGFLFPSLHQIEESFLIILYGSQWKRVRTLLTPTFSSGKLKKMFRLMRICIEDGKTQLDLLTSSGAADFDPKYFWGRYNMDVIAKCCFATNLNAYGNEDDVFLRNFIDFFKGNPLKLFSLTAFPTWFWKVIRLSFFPAKNLEFLRDLTLALIEKRKNNDTKAEDFLQLLIDSEDDPDSILDGKKSKLTTEEIVGASIIFLVAGYETTSTLLTWACYRLATNQNIQEKLYDEIKNADIYDYETLNSLPYLEAVICETLRIDPPLVLFQRYPHSDYILPGTSIQIKKGTPVSIPIYAIHHDPQNYTDPEVYDPNRFLNGNLKPFTFIPFGGGPRTCLGMRFATISAKLSLAVLIRNFKIFTTEKTPKHLNYSKGSLILTVNELKLGIKPRLQ